MLREKLERLIGRFDALNPRLRLLLGVLFIALGLLSLVTPLTPGSWLVFVGLELIGIRILAWRRFLGWLDKRRSEEDGEEKTRL